MSHHLQGLKRHWIYEVVLTAKHADRIAVGPFGLWTDDGLTLKATLFNGSSMFNAIRSSYAFAVNFIEEPLDLHDALNRRESLSYDFRSEGKIKPIPVLAKAPAWMTMEVIRFEDNGTQALMQAKIMDSSHRPPVTLINRAKGLFLESLVLSTRCSLLGQTAIDQLKENIRVIAKVAPGSRYEVEARALLANAESKKINHQ